MALKIEQRHGLEGDAATAAAEKFAEKAQNDEQMNKYVNLNWEWAVPGKKMSLDLKGRVKIKGELRLEAGKVVIELNLPLLAKPFGGIVRDRVEKNLKDIFA